MAVTVRVAAPVARAPGAAPLVLVHGLGATSRSFARLLERLPDAVAPVLVELPDGAPVDTEADALAARLDEAGVPAATVLGHSRGGAVALALAERRPDRVARLVLVATPPTPASRLASDGLQERLLAVPLLGDAMWALARRPVRARLAALAVPTDVVVGLADRRVDPAASDDLDAVPGVRVHRWDTGHSPGWEMPDRVAALLTEDR